MHRSPLDVELHHRAPHVTLKLRGELTALAREAFTIAYRQATELEADGIVLDFAEVELMNSAGIALLFGILPEVRKNNQRLVFAELTPHHRKILVLMGLIDNAKAVAKVFDSVGDAYAFLETKS